MDRFTTYKDGWRVLGDGAYMDDALSIRGDAIDRLAAYEDTGTEPEEIGDVVMHCKELGLGGLLGLLNAIATDRLIVLPCKVGDTVYWNTGVEVRQAQVIDFVIDSMMNLRLNLPTLGICPVFPYPGHIFLTREEAEAALEEKP